MGTFFRQYFFALDREELPFNRAERSWVYRAAKNVDATMAFGSTRDLRPVGTVYFVNCPFPSLESEYSASQEVTIGPFCQYPYVTCKPFHISGMSYGAISKPAVEALAQGAQKAGVWINTGEGGLSPYHLHSGADIVFQMGTAKFGVCNEEGELDEARLAHIAEYDQVKMFEIKLSQGAKPGKGGILPGKKVTQEIAQIRGIRQGSAAISPNRHPDISSIDDLLDSIERVRQITKKPVGFKLVVGDLVFFDALCHAIVERGEASAPDFMTLDSADGGSGAAPMSLMDNMGLPIKEGLPRVAYSLEKHGLRARIKLIASGKLINPSEVAWAFCAGADFVVSARGFMFALGCIQALQCNKNTCPTGITTHNKQLQKGLNVASKSERVANYALNMEKELKILAHSCGVNDVRGLRPHHARIRLDNGLSESLSDQFQRL